MDGRPQMSGYGNIASLFSCENEVMTLKGGLRMRGRPKKDGAKTKRITIRVTEEDFGKLEYLCSRTKLSKTEVLLKGLEMYSNWVKSVSKFG